MNLNKPESAKSELPEHVRRLIDGEIEAGLDHMRKGGFDARLKSAADREAVTRLRSSRRKARPWRPALAVVLTVVVLFLAVVVFRPFRSSAPDFSGGRDTLIAALQKAPGLLALHRIHADPLYAPIPADSGNSPLLRTLASAVTASATVSAYDVRPPDLAPRYDLQKKIDILVNERPFERALAAIKSKKGDTNP
jgi:hypothetical protein